MDSSAWLMGGTQDQASITKDWMARDADLIDGVTIREAKNVPTDYGYLTELFRSDWLTEQVDVGQVFQSKLMPGRISAWHAHAVTTDRLFVAEGHAFIALFDGRPGSPTHGQMTVVRASILRPMLITVPPKVWHGVKNTGNGEVTLVNMVDIAYQYDGPDHYRLPENTDLIPFDILNQT